MIERITSPEVDSPQRIVPHEIDDVVEDDDVGQSMSRIHPARRVRGEQNLRPERLHDAHGEGDFLHGVAFVEMKASFHGDHGNPAEIAGNELPGVRLDR